MKWLFYVIVFVYMFYRTVYGLKAVENELIVDPVNYGDDDFLKVGGHKTVSCRSSNRFQKVEWLDPNGYTVKRIPGSRIFSMEHFVQSMKVRAPALVLTITRAKVEDTGVYQCKAGELLKNVSLCVIDPSDFADTPEEVVTDLGRSITLSCQARGDPEPRISWKRDGVNISDDDSSGKYRVMTKYNMQGFEGLLTVTSLEPQDSGIYSCLSIQENPEVEDCSHTSMFNITLNVNYPPIFDEGNNTKFVYGNNNQQVDIVCSANGYPAPTYRFFKDLRDDILYEFDQKQIRLIEDGSKAVLSVIANQSTFFQRFKCQASNEHGESEMYFTLLKMEKPKKPSEISFVNATSDSVYINVTWFDGIRFPINAFEAQYFKEQGSKTLALPKESAWRKSRQAEISVDDVEPSGSELDGLVVALEDLDEETSYWIRLRVSNDVGQSLWSEAILATTTVKEATTEADPAAEPEVEGDDDAGMTDATFYGIFFAGGIFVVVFVSMFIMRLVK